MNYTDTFNLFRDNFRPVLCDTPFPGCGCRQCIFDEPQSYCPKVSCVLYVPGAQFPVYWVAVKKPGAKCVADIGDVNVLRMMQEESESILENVARTVISGYPFKELGR